jgi:hypothetical protein
MPARSILIKSPFLGFFETTGVPCSEYNSNVELPIAGISLQPFTSKSLSFAT